jgi:uncharacterized repeat protein (TIGR03803 family)
MLVCALCSGLVHAQSAPKFTSLATFKWTNGGDTGATPDFGNLVQGFDGNLYGTTIFGGANNNGTVFRIKPTGSLVSLYSFCSLANSMESRPGSPSSLILRSARQFQQVPPLGQSP